MFFKGQRSHLLLCALSATIPSPLTARAKKKAGPTNASPLQFEVTTVGQRDVTLYGDWGLGSNGHFVALLCPTIS